MRHASRMVRVAGPIVSILLVACGCATRHESSLLLERQARGPMDEESGIAHQHHWMLDPATQTKTQDGLEVMATYASREYLNELFRNQRIFGSFAGLNPFFPEQVVFYVKVTNHNEHKVHIDPALFILLDDKGNQYPMISPDYTNALAERKATIMTLARGVLDDARPGYFGIGVPVGKILGKDQRRFALLKMAMMQPGDLYEGVVYDGLVTFWSPHEDAQHFRLLLPDMRTDYAPDGLARKSIDIAFEFQRTK